MRRRAPFEPPEAGAMFTHVSRALQLFKETRNPVPIVLDRMSLARAPYCMQTKDGLRFELRPQRGDRFGFYEVIVRGDYTRFGQTIAPGATVIDIGANVGCFSILAAKLAGPQGRVIAVEPDPSNYAQLTRNIALNGATNVTPYRVAVGGTDGTTLLFSSDASSLFSSTAAGPAGGAGRTSEVEMMTLGSLMDRASVARCDYLKVDCEGAEYAMLDALTPDAARRIMQISIEIHVIPGRRPDEIHERLHALGFVLRTKQHVYYFRAGHTGAEPAARP